VSFFVLANGHDAMPLAAAEDHKPSSMVIVGQYRRHGMLFAGAAFDDTLESGSWKDRAADPHPLAARPAYGASSSRASC